MAISAADRIKRYLDGQNGAQSSEATTAPTAPTQPAAAAAARAPERTPEHLRDYYEGAAQLQRQQLNQQLLSLDIQNKTSQSAQFYQTMSSIEAKKSEVASSIANRIAR